ncbi:MAG: Glycosyl transferase group 1 [Candidatus Woesebacteria bacterium GW2011_GWC2_47_16]|nr:MAG: Glycosyl transferase group 1 [Candidatus Woesebacteria bacterium GW2011_GWE1_45_18]KKU25148.1 MAG: Glycosyl transferase group 1 [Candidatus Woesebacteria bacterium GW2011_GWF1_46_13]KKU65379.1 MAG: Glycosyl transferase group 1 [Candidatus Woesebacteria bacterium GW2011_GWC2_47_16]KKU71194.1 MAG: Glycosyl transferase group 1 [Candidatus Woesebacteria bacterium GW2011_GWD1_47_21]OGM85402.1 MAG: hypothetical protein A2435_02725 [Candidatus Woesebacteria bacterium RIFOXYC1_FULL_46_16]OGM89
MVLTWTKDNKDIKSSPLSQIKIALGLFWNREIEKELSQVIGKFKPDIVHFNNIFPLITPCAYYVCNQLGVPIVQTIHSFRFMFPKSIFFRRGELCPYCRSRKLFFPVFLHPCYHESLFYTIFFSLSHSFHTLIGSFKLVDLFIFPSLTTQKYYLKNSSLPPEKTLPIPNFVDEKTSFPKNYESPFFLYVGGLRKEKGIDKLVSLFNDLPNQKLLVIGEGELEKELRKIRKGKNILFLGRRKRTEILKNMAKALFTIIPSECLEVMPTVLIESFASKTAVIVPERGVFKELVTKAKTGFFYKNRAELKRLIERISKNPSLAEKMGKAAKNEAKKFTGNLYYKKIIKAYSITANFTSTKIRALTR